MALADVVRRKNDGVVKVYAQATVIAVAKAVVIVIDTLYASVAFNAYTPVVRVLNVFKVLSAEVAVTVTVDSFMEFFYYLTANRALAGGINVDRGVRGMKFYLVIAGVGIPAIAL